MPIRKLISRDVVTIGPDHGVDDAAKKMRDEEIGSVMVKDDGQIVGIVTERDIVTKVVAEYRPVKAMKIKEIMSSPLMSIDPDSSVFDAARKMATFEIRRLPIMDGPQLLGVVSERDLLRFSPDLFAITRPTK